MAKYFMIVFLCFICSGTLGQPDTAKHIIFEKEVCHRAEIVKGEIQLLHKGWYTEFGSDHHTEYDSSGRITAMGDYYTNGKPANITLFDEYPDGKLAAMHTTEFDYDQNTTDHHSTMFFYYVDNDSAHIKVDTSFDQLGSARYYSISRLSADGLTEHTTTFYGNNSKSTSLKTIFPGTTNYKVVWCYGEEPTRCRTTHYIKDTISNFSYYYNLDGKDTLSSSFEQYDEQDLITYSRRKSGMTKTEYWFAYEYDTYGNWTRRLVYSNSRMKKLVFVVDRELIYG